MTLSMTTRNIKGLFSTFSIMTFSITTFGHCAECQYAEAYHTECHYAECRYAVCRYAQCHYAECRYDECHHAECRILFVVYLSVVMQNVGLLIDIIQYQLVSLRHFNTLPDKINKESNSFWLAIEVIFHD